jgi:predicted MFS family arabinose efflux permease
MAAPRTMSNLPITPPHPSIDRSGTDRSRAGVARARIASRVHFAALGAMGGAWGVHIPSVKARYALDEGTLALVLLAAGVGAVLSLSFAGRLIARAGAPRALAGAAVVMAVLLALALQWPGLSWLLSTMLVFGAAMSLYDVAINTEGTALEAVGGRPVLGGLHAMFSVGGMGGAAAAAALLRADVDAGVQLAGISAAVLVAVLAALPWMLNAHPKPEGETEQAHFAWPRGRLLLIGLLILAGMTAEGVMYDWCVLYLKQELGLAQSLAGIGFAVFSGAMALARFGGDALRARFDEHRLLMAGAALAATSMAVVLLAAQPHVALVGYALVGIGLAPAVPLLFSAATRVPGVSRAAAIASVSSIGYAGFLIGPPVIGGLAKATSLTIAMGVVIVAAAALAVSARRIG